MIHPLLIVGAVAFVVIDSVRETYRRKSIAQVVFIHDEVYSNDQNFQASLTVILILT